MLNSIKKLLSGVFFIGGLSNLLPENFSSPIKLFSLGGMWISSLLLIERECKTFINYERRIPTRSENRTCWLRPARILTPVLDTVVTTAFFAFELFKLQSTDEQNNSHFLQGCYVGFAVSLLLESRASCEMVKRLGHLLDKCNSALSLLTSGALIVVIFANVKDYPAVENISLVAAGGLCLLQSSIRFKQECSKFIEEIAEPTNIEGMAVPDLYHRPLLLQS
jgi:hypothetical protein